MKRLCSLLLPVLLLAACSTTRITDSEMLSLYRTHADAPVKEFAYFGQINGWVPLGDQALAVWTKPNQAYLLELYGPCTDLEYAPAITVSNMMSRVSARFDSIYVHGGGAQGIRMPCRIETIRPVRLKDLKQAQKDLREAKLVERDAETK